MGLQPTSRGCLLHVLYLQALTGAISGAFTFRSASKVNPVDALRYE